MELRIENAAGLQRRSEASRQHGSSADEAPAQEGGDAEPQVAAAEPKAAEAWVSETQDKDVSQETAASEKIKNP